YSHLSAAYPVQYPSSDIIVSQYAFSFFLCRRTPRPTLFPTRRSSDLSGSAPAGHWTVAPGARPPGGRAWLRLMARRQPRPTARRDRKSTRLNSSHVATSYPVCCTKKQKKSKTVPTAAITAESCTRERR